MTAGLLDVAVIVTVWPASSTGPGVILVNDTVCSAASSSICMFAGWSIVGGSFTGFTVMVNEVSTDRLPGSVAWTVTVLVPLALAAGVNVRTWGAGSMELAENRVAVVLPTIVRVRAETGLSTSANDGFSGTVVGPASSVTVWSAMPVVVGASFTALTVTVNVWLKLFTSPLAVPPLSVTVTVMV